jgi:ABC-type multidrug transport system fused ATPase/permease subunit
LLRQPTILVLDEVTSHLDAESEAAIQQAIERAMEGRTVLIIAHRLSTVKNADRILVLQDGRIVEEGTHEQLLAKGTLYRRLYELQRG